MGRVNGAFLDPSPASHLILFGAPLSASSVSPIKIKVKVTSRSMELAKNLLMSLPTRDLATLQNWLTPAD